MKKKIYYFAQCDWRDEAGKYTHLFSADNPDQVWNNMDLNVRFIDKDYMIEVFRKEDVMECLDGGITVQELCEERKVADWDMYFYNLGFVRFSDGISEEEKENVISLLKGWGDVEEVSENITDSEMEQYRKSNSEGCVDFWLDSGRFIFDVPMSAWKSDREDTLQYALRSIAEKLESEYREKNGENCIYSTRGREGKEPVMKLFVKSDARVIDTIALYRYTGDEIPF